MINLTEEREKKGMSQEQLASVVGVSRQALSAIERGITKPSIDTAKKLAEALDLKWSDFFEEAESTESKV